MPDMTDKEKYEYLAQLEKAQPGITTKVFGGPFNPWTIRGEVLGFEDLSLDDGGGLGLWQINTDPWPRDRIWVGFDPASNARAALAIYRRAQEPDPWPGVPAKEEGDSVRAAFDGLDLAMGYSRKPLGIDIFESPLVGDDEAYVISGAPVFGPMEFSFELDKHDGGQDPYALEFDQIPFRYEMTLALRERSEPWSEFWKRQSDYATIALRAATVFSRHWWRCLWRSMKCEALVGWHSASGRRRTWTEWPSNQFAKISNVS